MISNYYHEKMIAILIIKSISLLITSPVAWKLRKFVIRKLSAEQVNEYRII